MRSVLLAIVICSALLAQDRETAEPALFPASDTAPTAVDPYLPLTLSQNYVWTVHQIFDPTQLMLIGARAAIDHSDNDPSRWGQGTEGYAVRVASRLGVAAVRQNFAFAVRALDHEDPRYFRSPAAGFWKRAGYAVSRTFVTRSTEGGTMPAYSVLAAGFATPFIAGTWRPEPIRGGREIRTGAIGIGMEAAGNIGREFWPDIRKKVLH
jgi:hypothetical protein